MWPLGGKCRLWCEITAFAKEYFHLMTGSGSEPFSPKQPPKHISHMKTKTKLSVQWNNTLLRKQLSSVACYRMVEDFFFFFFNSCCGPRVRKCNWGWQVHPNAPLLLCVHIMLALSRTKWEQAVLNVCVRGEGSGGLTHRSKGLLGTVTSEQSHTQFKVNTISVAASSVCSWALWEPEMKQCLKRLHRLGLPVLSFVLGLSGHMPFHLVYFIIVYQSVSGKWVTKSILLQVETFSYNLSAVGKVFSGIEVTMKP